tara:strand:- start:7916 stop:8671 length:756 start_codon:yes stop_codon:yes gene_type:complete
VSNLWVFGDSFVSDKNHWYFYNEKGGEWKCPDWHWPRQLCTKLGTESVAGASLPGVSNEWIGYQISEYRNKNKFKKDDYIVVVSTSIHRRWLLKEPSLGNLYVNNLKRLLPKNTFRAVQLYQEEFTEQHEKLSEIYYEWFLTWVREILKNYKFCLLPGFDSTRLHHVPNDWGMVQAEEAEFKNCADDKWMQEKIWDGSDKRLGHFSRCNHDILSDKIAKYFKTGELVNFQTDFKRSLFTCEQDLIDYKIEL